MAMTLPIPIPSTPSPNSSASVSDRDSNPPRTPVSPSMLPHQPDTTNSQQQPPNQMKRKPSRRANTAERRATHNAVERQRRETLNGRFLDLAALLPNLSQIRRPSKSSIVNSSIAHIHASRRHRHLAARELRLVKLESDALRRELNEWRDRAGLPRVEEPVRSEGFSMVLSGELEVLAAVPGDDDDEEGPIPGYGGYDDVEDDYGVMHRSIDEVEPMLKNTNSNPFAYTIPTGPVIAANPTAVSYENPAMNAMYEPHPHPSQYSATGSHFIPPDTDKSNAAWNAHLFGQQQQQHHQHQHQPQHQQQHQIMHAQAQRTLFTPPASSQGLPAGAHAAQFADPAFYAALQQRQHIAAMHQHQHQQQQQQQQQQMGHSGHMYGSPEADDASSVGSGAREGRARSGSLSAGGSGYGGSPPRGGGTGYDLPSGDFGVPRRMNSGVGTYLSAGAGAAPVSVGGGGNGAGFAMLM